MEVCYTNIKNKDFYLADKIISIHHNCICTNHSMGLTSNQYYIRTSINVKLDCFSNESKLYYGSMSSFGGNFFPHHEYTFVDFYKWVKEIYGDDYQYLFEGNKLGLL